MNSIFRKIVEKVEWSKKSKYFLSNEVQLINIIYKAKPKREIIHL
jgi:hypothetical protein